MGRRRIGWRGGPTLDNARYHHAQLVQQWLAQRGRRIRLRFIPVYCPHLDPIERLWGLMHRHTTHNKGLGQGVISPEEAQACAWDDRLCRAHLHDPRDHEKRVVILPDNGRDPITEQVMQRGPTAPPPPEPDPEEDEDEDGDEDQEPGCLGRLSRQSAARLRGATNPPQPILPPKPRARLRRDRPALSAATHVDQKAGSPADTRAPLPPNPLHSDGGDGKRCRGPMSPPA
jgi:hypothetical protein